MGRDGAGGGGGSGNLYLHQEEYLHMTALAYHNWLTRKMALKASQWEKIDTDRAVHVWGVDLNESIPYPSFLNWPSRGRVIKLAATEKPS